ncbi:MAG: PD40 domain-containing protein [Acidobacteriota bacterium]|nr:PD40 domain-containing protein [Acidobacteriota bacterium]
MKTAGGTLRAAFLMAVILVSAACSQTINYPVPSVGSLSPNSAPANGAAFTLSVKGNNFVFGAFIDWNGVPQRTLFVNGGELQAQIAPGLISMPGSAPVLVVNPPPGGGPSNAVNFTINPVTSPVPTIASIQPTGTTVAGSGLTLTVKGTNFVSTSVVTWNGQNLPTSFANPTEIFGAVSSTLTETPGTAQIAVINPPPGGGSSLSVPFNVNNPPPTISSISPTTSIASAPSFTITVNGTGFTCAQFTVTTTTSNGTTTTTCSQPASSIAWNGTPLTTTFVSPSQLTATVNTPQLAQAGTSFVTVVNPAPGGGTSANAFFQVIPGPNGEGLPALVDVNSTGDQAANGIGNLGLSGPVIGGGGRFIAFSSVSQNLVSNLSNGVANVFVRDTCLGIATGCTPQTALASVGNNSQPPNADCLQPSISSDGRYIAYTSKATNLVSSVMISGTTNEIYLTDTCMGAASGCTPSTTLVSLAADGVSPANGSSTEPYISPDSQYIVFVSNATNLTSQATTGATEVYERSTCLNAIGICTPTTTLVSLASDGVTPSDGASATPVVSSGGRYVAFQSTATNLVSVPSSGTQQLYWRDTCTGVTSGCTPSTSLISIASDGTSPGNAPSVQPALSSDGRYVVFGSQATNLIGAGFVSGTPQQVYERDMCAGVSGCTPSTSLLSVATDGSSPGNALSEHPVTDQSGRYVLFGSKASNLVSAQTNGFEQIFARDTCIGATSACTPRTALISVAGDGTTIGNGDSLYPAITTQAGFAAFLSFSNNIVTDDTTPSLEDIFLAVTTF